jgi:hypothetical protein
LHALDSYEAFSYDPGATRTLPRKDSFRGTELKGGEERRGRRFRPFGEIKTDAEINPYKDDFVDHFGDLEAERLVG